MANENNAESGKVENFSEMGDNTSNEVGNTVAEGRTSEEATANEWKGIIDAKDQIISAYESQVESLKNQVERLMRNGAAITDGNSKGSDESANENDAQASNVGNALGGFGSGLAGTGDYVSVKDLGREIGKRER